MTELDSPETRKIYGSNLLSEAQKEALTAVEQEIVELWMPDVLQTATSVSRFVEGRSGGVVMVQGPGHGRGKSSIFLPTLMHTLENEHPDMLVEIFGGGFDFRREFPIGFAGGRGVSVVDEVDFTVQDMSSLRGLLRQHTLANVWVVQAANHEMRREMANYAADKLTEQGIEVQFYEPNFNSVPVALAKKFLSCFSVANVYFELMDDMQVITPRFLSRMAMHPSVDDLANQIIEAGWFQFRSVVSVDRDIVGKSLGFDASQVREYDFIVD